MPLFPWLLHIMVKNIKMGGCFDKLDVDFQVGAILCIPIFVVVIYFGEVMYGSLASLSSTGCDGIMVFLSS